MSAALHFEKTILVSLARRISYPVGVSADVGATSGAAAVAGGEGNTPAVGVKGTAAVAVAAAAVVLTPVVAPGRGRSRLLSAQASRLLLL